MDTFGLSDFADIVDSIDIDILRPIFSNLESSIELFLQYRDDILELILHISSSSSLLALVVF